MNSHPKIDHNKQPTHQKHVRGKLFCACEVARPRGQAPPHVVSDKSIARFFDAYETHHVLKDDKDDDNNNNNNDIVPTCRYCGGHVLLKSR
jgi:hypothetical protein